MLIAAEDAALPVNPVPAEVTPSTPVTLTKFRFAPAELLDSRVAKVTLAPNAPLVETFRAPPVPVFPTVLIIGEPTAAPLNPKKAGVLPTFKPRTVFPLPRSTPLPAVVVITGAVLVPDANVLYAAMLLASAVK